MKKAFTLAEVLITLGIIGVIAALIVPAISNVKPDKNKTAYLQVYDTISSTVNSLAHNSKIYPTCKDLNEVDNVNCDQNPLFNTNLPLEPRYRNNRYSGDKKLCSLMATSLGISDGDIDAGCTDTVYAFNAANYTNGFANPSFVTKNGMRWRISPAVASSSDGTVGTYQTDIYVDIDATNNDTPNGDRSCIYDQNNCTEPDIFKFMVSANGEVTPADPMGRAYIQSRKSLIKKNININDHIIASVSQFRPFSYEHCRQVDPEEQCALEGRHWYNDACHDCPVNEILYNGTCMTEEEKCINIDGGHWYNNICNACSLNEVEYNGQCMDHQRACEAQGMYYNPDGTCTLCPLGQQAYYDTNGNLTCREQASITIILTAQVVSLDGSMTQGHPVIYTITGIQTEPQSEDYALTFIPIRGSGTIKNCIGTKCLGLKLASGSMSSPWSEFKSNFAVDVAYSINGVPNAFAGVSPKCYVNLGGSIMARPDSLQISGDAIFLTGSNGQMIIIK